MSRSPSFDPWGSKSKSSVPEAHRHTCGPRGPSCQQMTTEHRDTPFSSGTAAASRRLEASGSAPEGRGHGDYGGLQLYRRQFADGAPTDAGRPQQSSFSCLQQSAYLPELPEVPAEPHCFLPENHPSCTSLSPLGQVSLRHYQNNDDSASKYFQIRQEGAAQMLFPKPIYSYSTLIFMALMNSKAGSLPVSEIYSFMTEHFPYFKTAPDGWKNSVRHNLSLNKCFVKIENKSVKSSRKGCLWTLNPAKVEKMREELRKWRRKDPVTVRRSMARPECLDRLLGERPNKLRHYGGAALSPRGAPAFRTPVRSGPAASPSQPRPCVLPPPCAPYAHAQPQRSCCYPAPFALHSPCGQTTAVGGLNSPPAGMVPPVYGVSPRSVQDVAGEAYAGYDVDALNPSLTDLQLQGNLWEELQEDCLTPDPQVSSGLVDLSVPPGCLQAPASSLCPRTREDQRGEAAERLEPRGCWSGPHAATQLQSGVEILAGYVTTCTTSISLM